MAMFYGGVERLGKSDRRIEMEAIDRRLASGAFFPDKRGAVKPIGERMADKIPSTEEIIFGPCAVDGWPGFPVNEKHVVAFAPPSILILEDGHRNSHEMSAACGVHPDVIFLAVKVGLTVNSRITIALPVRGPTEIGLRLAELRLNLQRSPPKTLSAPAPAHIEIHAVP